MKPDTLVSISRHGTVLGQFTLSVVQDGLTNGKFKSDDFYWCKGMVEWENLTKLPAATKQVTTEFDLDTLPVNTDSPTLSTPTTINPVIQPKPTPAKPPGPPPPTPIISTPIPSTSKTPIPNTSARKIMTAIFFVIGTLLFLHGLLTDPQGSAIRQQVLVQHMTNGLLFAILGMIGGKRD
jgi:hypothetical protein